MGSISQPGMLGSCSCQSRRCSKQARAKAASPLGPNSQAAPQPASQPAANKVGEQIGIAVVAGVVSVGSAYLLSAYSLPGKLDRLTETVEKIAETAQKAAEKNAENFHKLSTETAEYRREVAEVRGGFQILLDKFLPPKK